MSIFYQCLFTINVHLLSMSIYYQCQFTINVHLLSMSIYCQSLFTINVHLLSMSVYYQCPFTINVHLLSMSVYYQCLFTINVCLLSMSVYYHSSHQVAHCLHLSYCFDMCTVYQSQHSLITHCHCRHYPLTFPTYYYYLFQQSYLYRNTFSHHSFVVFHLPHRYYFSCITRLLSLIYI